MPKQFLNATKISPIIEQVSGKGVTKKVRVYVQEQGAFFNVLLQVSLNGSSGDPVNREDSKKAHSVPRAVLWRRSKAPRMST